MKDELLKRRIKLALQEAKDGLGALRIVLEILERQEQVKKDASG